MQVEKEREKRRKWNKREDKKVNPKELIKMRNERLELKRLKQKQIYKTCSSSPWHIEWWVYYKELGKITISNSHWKHLSATDISKIFKRLYLATMMPRETVHVPLLLAVLTFTGGPDSTSE